MDRRTYIGLILIMAVVALVLLWTTKSNNKTAPAKAAYEQKLDSVNSVQTESLQDEGIASIQPATEQIDSLAPLFPAMNGTESTYTLDNGLVRIGISSKGAAPCFAQLSGYK